MQGGILTNRTFLAVTVLGRLAGCVLILLVKPYGATVRRRAVAVTGLFFKPPAVYTLDAQATNPYVAYSCCRLETDLFFAGAAGSRRRDRYRGVTLWHVYGITVTATQLGRAVAPR